MKLFYTPLQSVEDSACFSPSAGKPAKLVAVLVAERAEAVLVEPAAVAVAEIERVHDRGYVAAVLECREPNGYGTTSREIAAALPYVLGSHLAAARAALDGEIVTCSPTSGFHHARHGSGGGYCTFNGLMVTAAALHREGRVRRVAVLDCDQHYGDGTEEIQQRLGLDWIWTQGRQLQRALDGKAYLEALERLIDQVLAFDPDLVLFQAGADPHEKDPLGGVLSTEQMRLRDRRVFQRLCGGERAYPLVWNLAGGYQKDADGGISAVLELHVNTYDEAVAVHRNLRVQMPRLPG